MKLSLLPHQYDFISSSKKYSLLLGGIGSGKSYAGSVYAIKSAVEYPNALGGIFANTYKQLLNSTLKSLFGLLTDLGISFSFNQNRSILKINESSLLCMSLENYDAIRGVEIGYAWIDECAYAKEDAFSVLSGRLRDKRGPLQMRLTTTPRGYNWLFDFFQGERKTSEFEMFNSSTRDNPHLPQSYKDTLYEQFDSKLIEQELEGKFTNITQGKVYYAFDRKKNISTINRDERMPIYIAMDFNRSPMTAVVANVYGDKINVFDEIFLMDSNTNEMADYIISKYGTGHQVIPDATGKAIKTSAAGLSDHEILRNKGFRVVGSSNPFRVDRYNTVNNLFDKNKVFINTGCNKLIRDLEQVSYKEGTNLPDTSNTELTHISDALGYLCWHVFPILKRGEVKVRAYA